MDGEMKSLNRTTRFFIGAVSLMLLTGCDDSGGLPALITGNTDIVPPVVTSTFPSSGQGGVSALATITATFSESLDPTTVNTSTVLVTAAATGVGIAGTVSYNSSLQQAIFLPSSTLAANTSYTVTLTTGIKDIAGNPMAANNVFTFTTAP